MGYDTSFHPIDDELLHGRIVPWILGTTPDDALDDLFARAATSRPCGSPPTPGDWG